MGSGIYFGAIRWDNWYALTGPALSVLRSLSNSKYQMRAPVHARIVTPARITFDVSQAVIDAEILAAIRGGISYWAFLLYDPATSPTLMVAYDLFQSSSIKNQIKWAMIRQTNDWGTSGNYSTKVALAVSQVTQSNYQLVLTNRPLVYIYYQDSDITSYWGSSTANFKSALDQFRADVQLAGLGDPYIVLLKGSNYAAIKTAIGADAVSNYISNFTQRSDAAYTLLDADAQAWWETQRLASGKVVPVCMAGWSRKPRIERPVAWEVSTQTAYLGLSSGAFSLPTNQELVNHFQAAIDYINAHPTDCDASTALIYAWNESDEGGWLWPTLGDPTGSRLDAIASTIGY